MEPPLAGSQNLMCWRVAFATRISSHCIEHQPDLIGHLIGVARLLSTNGLYFLTILDKRSVFLFSPLCP
jgi:hypothetical protein